MTDVTTTQSVKQTDNLVPGEFKALGPVPPYVGDEIIVMRCAETINEIFTDWTTRSKLGDNSYLPFDVNAPIELPRRSSMLKSYTLDPPITETGKIASKMMAREICDRRATPSVIICSPDFASVETAHLIKSYIGEHCGKIQIEPELSTLHKAAHVFFSPETFKTLGYGIDQKIPLAPVSDGVSLSDLVSRIKRAFYELTSKVENALLIVDPLSMMIISSLFHPIKIRTETSVELQRLRSLSSYPSVSNFTCFRSGGQNGAVSFNSNSLRIF
uniref:NADP-dependent malic enzyme n=1 Tax=Caenorhabditis tropicalis TaxID=1561998 RepID=A0A1I7UBU4_9PELO